MIKKLELSIQGGILNLDKIKEFAANLEKTGTVADFRKEIVGNAGFELIVFLLSILSSWNFKLNNINSKFRNKIFYLFFVVVDKAKIYKIILCKTK